MEDWLREAAKRIQKARMGKGLSQAEFARLTGYSLSYVKKVESGYRPLTAAFLRAVCDALDVSADHLLYGEHETAYEAWQMIEALPDAEKAECLLWLLKHFLKD